MRTKAFSSNAEADEKQIRMSEGESEGGRTHLDGLFPRGSGIGGMAADTAGRMANETVTPPRPERQREQGSAPQGGAVVSPSALDITIPRIEKPKEKDILALFVHQELDRIHGQPSYTTLVHVRKQCAKNALRVPSKFGGGKTGHAGMVIKPSVFEKKAGTLKWKVPDSKGMFPIFPAGINDDEKKAIIADHVDTEENILRAKNS